MRFVKTKSAQPKGDYKETAIDARRKSADFVLTQVAPKNLIVWRDGTRQEVSDGKLQRLQAIHSWATDF